MKHSEPISAIMTREVHTVSLDQELSDVVKILKKYKIRHIPVTDDNEVVGIISRTDINRLTFGALLDNQDGVDEAILTMLSISQVMTHKPRLVKTDSSVKDVAEIFTREEFHALPVTDGNNNLVGIVTTKDIIGYLLEN